MDKATGLVTDRTVGFVSGRYRMFLSGLRASVALEEGMCGAVESEEPSLRVESVGQHRQAGKLEWPLPSQQSLSPGK